MSEDELHPAYRRALRRGERQKEVLLERADGTWTLQQVARHLSISPEAVRSKCQEGRLIAVEVDGEARIPRCQFDDGGVIDGLEEVVQAMSAESGWTKLALLYSGTLTGEGANEGETILAALRSGHRDAAFHAASTWGEHSAS